MEKKKEAPITCVGYFRMPGREEDKNAKTYYERIKPTLVTPEEYFATVESKEEWQKRHEERALSNLYGVPVEVTIKKGA